MCHSLQLRPSLWAVVFDTLQKLGQEWSWRQDDPSSATVQEVITEINTASDNAIFSGCMMIGQVIELSTDTIPSWCLLCDGTTYADVDYPELGAAIHAGLRVDGTHFRVPQREIRFALGGAFVGNQGGEETHVLTVAELAEHEHGYTAALLYDVPLVTPGDVDGWIGTQPADTAPNGEGVPHNNMPPFEYTQFVIIAKYPSAG